MYTLGKRTRELVEANWEDIHFDKAMWVIPTEHMKMNLPLVCHSFEMVVYLNSISYLSTFLLTLESTILS